MHFFNRVAGFNLFNDKPTFLLFMALCCGSNIKSIESIIKEGEFDILPGMLQTMIGQENDK